MKKLLAFALAAVICLSMAACGKGADKSEVSSDSSTISTDSTGSATETSDSATDTTVDTSDSTASSQGTTKATTTKPTTKATTKPTTTTKPSSPYPVYTEGDMEYTRFTAFEKSTQAQLDSMLKSNVKAYTSTNKAHMPSGATAAIKLEYRKEGGWCQLLDMVSSKNGAGTKLVDPFPITLSDYEGFRFWVEVTPEQPQGFTVLRVFVGDWGYGYRAMYQMDIDIPAAGYKGYVEVPFDEMKDSYGSPASADPDNMDYIGLNFSTPNGCQTNVDIYVSDVQAYRSL